MEIKLDSVIAKLEDLDNKVKELQSGQPKETQSEKKSTSASVLGRPKSTLVLKNTNEEQEPVKVLSTLKQLKCSGSIKITR